MPEPLTVSETEGVASQTEVYPVGLLHDLQLFIHNPDRKQARQRLRSSLRYPLGQARARNWRALRNYFNGYLAEHPMSPQCGHGWTRGRAFRDLTRHLADATFADGSQP